MAPLGEILPLGVIVDVDALWQSVVAALVAGVGVVLVFALTVLGAARFADHSRDGRPFAAALSGLVVVAGLATTAAAIVIGIIAMAS